MHPSKTPYEKTEQNPSKPFSSFLYKLIFVSVFIALLPLLPSSQNPEFSNNSFMARSYELLHLLLVGITISYGLFSCRNSDPDVEKEIQLKTDTTQSYVSKILNVSSVFDDEEIESPKEFDFVDETKNQTWNYSQYYREKPVVMVAEESVDGTDDSTKPMFLPVRSLKLFDSGYESKESSFSFTSNQKDEVGKNEKIGGKEGVVLPSPIPWRSISGKMEVKEESPPPPPPPYSPSNSASNKEVGPSRTQSFKSPSPKRLSPSSSLSHEIREKFNEDSGRRKSFHKPSPPPPPPPPPPPLNCASQFISEKRDTRKSCKDELEDLSKRGRREFGSDSFNSEQVFYTKRSVRTVRSKEAQGLPRLPRNQSEKRNEFMEKIITHSDSESDDDNESFDVEGSSNSTSTEAGPQENEVDKKADEFIAKFREQIRLQRIASIKKSSGQRTARSSK